jgi:hypothetical protein
MTPLGKTFANPWMLHVWVVPGDNNPLRDVRRRAPVLA